MLYKKTILGAVLAVILLAILPGCFKDKTVIIEGPEINRTVSFTSDIIPLFNSSCNNSGCHSTGGRSPDLSIANAYNSLSNGSYFNNNDPQNSELYLWMSGKKGTPMPVSGVNKEFNALILAWIKQGAQNN